MKTVSDRDIKFLLKDARATGPTLVYLVYRYGDQRFKTSTGQTLEPYLWDTDKQRAITDKQKIRSKPERETNETINAHLERNRSALVKVLNRLQLAGEPLTNETIKHYLDKELGREKKEKPPVQAKPETFTEYITRFVADAQAGNRLNAKSGRYAPPTLTGYLKLVRLLADFKTDTRRGIDFANFTIDQYHAFKIWLTNRAYSLNYIGALLKDLKLLLKQSHEEGLHTSTGYQHKEFRKLTEEVDNVYLTTDELQHLNNLDLTHNPRLDRVRDLFLIGAYTGLRFSDFSDLRPENITPDGQILIRKTLKTAKRVSIPLNQNVLAILRKYAPAGSTGPGMPQTITNQRMNIYLKELMQLAGFTERVEVGRTRGGAKETHYLEKWELISTHTARRSFATNAFLAGVEPIKIMQCTGHTSESMFLKYIKITSEQNARLLLNHPHFGGTGIQTQDTTIVRPLRRAA